MPDSDQSITTFSLSSRDRQGCLEKLTSLLERETKVIFAYAHGSFVQDLPFRDLDIAVYLDPHHIPDDRYSYEDRLSHELAQKLQVAFPIDTRILNQTPIPFQYHVLKGHLLLDRDPEARVSYMEYIISRYLDMEPILRHHIREVVESGPES